MNSIFMIFIIYIIFYKFVIQPCMHVHAYWPNRTIQVPDVMLNAICSQPSMLISVIALIMKTWRKICNFFGF